MYLQVAVYGDDWDDQIGVKQLPHLVRVGVHEKMNKLAIFVPHLLRVVVLVEAGKR